MQTQFKMSSLSVDTVASPVRYDRLTDQPELVSMDETDRRVAETGSKILQVLDQKCLSE
jgi:hypothetical protein